MNYARDIDGVTYIDMERLWQSIESAPAAQKLRAGLIASGVTFFDDEKNFIDKPVAAITGFGGFPVSFTADTPPEEIIVNTRSATPAEHLAEFQKTRGLAGLITNMNTGRRATDSMDDLTTKLKHFSKLRTNIIDFHIFGYPAAIEPNFMRLYKYAEHVGCLTFARTAAQSDPPWCLLMPENLAAAQDLRKKTMAALPAIDKKRAEAKDLQEDLNGLQAKNAAMILMLNIDLNNLRGAMNHLSDDGQEAAWRRILALINDQMHILFPAFFEETSAYGFEMPEHWQKKAGNK